MTLFKRNKKFRTDVKNALSDIYKRENSRDKLAMIYMEEKFPCMYRSFGHIDFIGDRWRCLALEKVNYSQINQEACNYR